MIYALRQWPASVYPGEAEEIPDARAEIDQALRDLSRCGPTPLGRSVKCLGKQKAGLWQLNMRVKRKQIRILYAPLADAIVIYCVHKKGSPQEQERAYQRAMKRKREAEDLVGKSNDILPTIAVH